MAFFHPTTTRNFPELPQLDRKCLLAFSSPFRAADYASVQIPGEKFAYLCSSPEQVVCVVRDCERAGVSDIALDRCPRCNICTTVTAASLASAAQVIEIWKIFKATEAARCGLYWEYARTAAREGQFTRARDVALQIVGHVTIEDPRSHLLLGTLAISLRDRQLLREAKEFLTFLRQKGALDELWHREKAKIIQF